MKEELVGKIPKPSDRAVPEEERPVWPRILAMLGGVLLLVIFGLLLVVYVARKTHLGQSSVVRPRPTLAIALATAKAGRGESSTMPRPLL